MVRDEKKSRPTSRSCRQKIMVVNGKEKKKKKAKLTKILEGTFGESLE